MTADTTSRSKHLDLASVVVAKKTFCPFVLPLELNPRLFFVIKREVRTDLVPPVSHVAKRTIPWKTIMRNDRTSLLAPLLGIEENTGNRQPDQEGKNQFFCY